MEFKIYGHDRETGKQVSGVFIAENAKDAARQVTENYGWTISHVRFTNKVAGGLTAWSFAFRIAAGLPIIFCSTKYADNPSVLVAGFLASLCIYAAGLILLGLAELIVLASK